MKSIQRIVSGLLVFCMVVSILPVTVWAEETILAENEAEAYTEVAATTEAIESRETSETTAPEPVKSTVYVEPTERYSETDEDDTQPETIVVATVDENTIVASGICGENLTWVLDENGVLTISGTGDMNNYSDAWADWYDYRNQIISVIIQDGVASIGDGAFSANTNVTFGYSNLTDITIPESVVKIGDCAFTNCTKLSDITIPDGVKSIGGSAFERCTSLNRITLPGSVTYIGDYAFAGCTSLETFVIANNEDSAAEVMFIAEGEPYYYTFDDCTSLTNVTFGNTVKYIPSYLFWDIESLENVTVSSALISIGEGAFAASGLLEIELPDSLREIGVGAFACCNDLSEIILPGNVTSIGACAFMGCGNLTGFTVQDCDDVSVETFLLMACLVKVSSQSVIA